jgi:hypothetical protein
MLCLSSSTDPPGRHAGGGENNVNIVCYVAYDVIDSTYDIAYDENRTTL